MHEVSPSTLVVVVETRLAEQVGFPGQLQSYEDAAHIQEINHLLSQYYGYLHEHHPELAYASCEGLEEWLFTDGGHEYGVVPEHLNALVNEFLARRVREVL